MFPSSGGPASRVRRWAAAAVAAAALSGCAAFRPGGPRDAAPDASPSDRRFLSVPFFSDGTDQCGPAAAAAVLSFWGDPVDAAAMGKEVYTARIKGSLPIDLLLAAQRRGFKATLYRGSIDDLKSELRKGHPLIAFTNRGFAALPIGHYVVVTGYDEERRGLHVHSGLSKNIFVPYKRFLRDWEKTQRSTLLILPSGDGGGTSRAGT